MLTAAYYRQKPIRDCLHEYLSGALSFVTDDPGTATEKYHPISALDRVLESGSDIYRSILDRQSALFVIDLDYANLHAPGEIFNNPQKVFQELDVSRFALRELLGQYGIEFLEIMTGRGYHYVTQIPRASTSYENLYAAAAGMKVLPLATAVRLLEEAPPLDTSVIIEQMVFNMLGRLADLLVDKLAGRTGLLLRTTDIYDEPEIVIYDSTMYGYLVTRRTTRCCYSLIQKPTTTPKYNYNGPPLVAIPTAGLPLEVRLRIRSDSSADYHRAVSLAREQPPRIPWADFTPLLEAYLVSATCARHQNLVREIGEAPVDTHYRDELLAELERLQPHPFNYEWFWGPLAPPDETELKSVDFSPQMVEILERPNDLLLKPDKIRQAIRELREHNFSFPQIIAVMAAKYRGNFAWEPDLWRNDPELRAEYWVRTLSLSI